MRSKFHVIVLCAVLAPFAAFADDSSAALGAGGIVFTRDTPVRMADENLYISPKQVRVRFVFRNDTDKDVQTIVAFPLPDIDEWEFWGSPIGTITDDPLNFVGFGAVVDGKPVAFKTEQHAFVKGRDVTARIAAVGAPINPAIGEGYRQLEALAPGKRKQLMEAGIAMGDANEFVPQWVLRTKFYWLQRFPAHKTVVIEHSYQPVSGRSFFGEDELTDRKDGTTDVRDFCIDAQTAGAIRARTAKLDEHGPNGKYLQAYQTEYVLRTANNWKGPIGRFHLTLDKLKSDNLMSLCWDESLKKTGATTFALTRENFAPTRDIKLLVLQ